MAKLRYLHSEYCLVICFFEQAKILFPTSPLSVHPSVSPLVSPLCVQRLTPIPAGESQDVTNKCCSIYLRG